MTAEVGAARHSLSVADLATWVRRSAALIAEHAEELRPSCNHRFS